MAMQVLTTVALTVVGDGSSTSLVFPPLAYIPNTAAVLGLVPASATSHNAACTASIDVGGNLVLTFGVALGAGVQLIVLVDLFFNSGGTPKTYGIVWDGVNASTVKAASVGPTEADTAIVVTQSPSGRHTYRACVIQYAPAGTPTDVGTIYGSATKIVRVTRVFMQGGSTSTSKSGSADCSLVKRAATNTGGTSAPVAAVPLDSANGAATATVLKYTANPTALGTSLGLIANRFLSFVNTGFTGTEASPFDVPLASNPGVQGITLHGVNEGLAISLNAEALPTGGTIGWTIEWTEE